MPAFKGKANITFREIRVRGCYYGQSGYDVLQCIGRLVTQSGHELSSLRWNSSPLCHSVIEPVKRCGGTARKSRGLRTIAGVRPVRVPPRELFPLVFLKLQEQVVLESVAPGARVANPTIDRISQDGERDDGTRHSRFRTTKQRTRDAGGKLRNELGPRVRWGE